MRPNVDSAANAGNLPVPFARQVDTLLAARTMSG
jgi:hypothetical protein